jgi:NACalpha-BTF3-like transcription factor
MFTSKISHTDLVEAGLLVSEGFRGYKASPKFISLSKRAESAARASMVEGHDYNPLYVFADNRWNGEVLTKVVRNLRTELSDIDTMEVTTRSRTGNYLFTVPNYFIKEYDSKGKIVRNNAFSNIFSSSKAQMDLALKRIDPVTKLPFSSIYENVVITDPNSMAELIDAYMLKLSALIEEEKTNHLVAKFNFINIVEIGLEKLGETAEGKVYKITKNEVVEI